MKNRTMPEIEIALKPPRLLTGLLVGVALLGLWAVVAYGADWRLQLALAVLLLPATVYHVLRDTCLYLPTSWKHLQVTSKGELRLTNNTGQEFTPALADNTWVHPWLTILNFKRPSGSKPWQGFPPVIVLWCDDESYRKLRVWLRWWRHVDANQLASSDVET